jgi:hypothetical protein
MSAAGYVEPAAPAPAAELRTSLAVASLGAALIHLMSAAHGPAGLWPAGVPLLVMGGMQGAVAAFLGTARWRWPVAPAATLNFTLALAWAGGQARGLQISIADVMAALLELMIAGGAVALLRGSRDRTLSGWSKAALVVFALAAFTGFGHLGH